jgi:hypothetical protein
LHRKIRACERKWNARQSSTTSDVDDGGVGRYELGQRGAVQEVARPDPRRLARTDDPGDYTVSRQQIGIVLRKRKPDPEDLPR